MGTFIVNCIHEVLAMLLSVVFYLNYGNCIGVGRYKCCPIANADAPDEVKPGSAGYLRIFKEQELPLRTAPPLVRECNQRYNHHGTSRPRITRAPCLLLFLKPKFGACLFRVIALQSIKLKGHRRTQDQCETQVSPAIA